LQDKELWSAAKSAVRAYARNPSEQNALNVELVWERLREHNSSAIWRQMRRKWLKQGTETALQDRETNGLALPGQFERDVA
jgi:hypothetical protein